MLAQTYAVLERYTDALTALRTAEEIGGRKPLILVELASVLNRLGEREKARRILGELIELSRREHVPLYQLALAHLSLGDETTAFDLVEQAYEQHSTLLPWIAIDIGWQVSRNHPRMIRMLDKLNLPHS